LRTPGVEDASRKECLRLANQLRPVPIRHLERVDADTAKAVPPGFTWLDSPGIGRAQYFGAQIAT
jgi:hypothetical protein